MTDRKTFTIPDGYIAVRDSDGRATGEVTRCEAGAIEIATLQARVEEPVDLVPAQAVQEPAFIRVGWFNPYNDYHGFQQVHRSYEGGKGTFPLFCRASDLAKTDLPTSLVPDPNSASGQ